MRRNEGQGSLRREDGGSDGGSGSTRYPSEDGKYTWSNRRVGIKHVAARLDKFLVSSTFLQKDLLSTSLALPSAVSDHKPLALILSPPANLGPIPFKFNPIWLHDVKIMELIQREWNTQHLGSPGYIWDSKLRTMKDALNKWVKEEFEEPNKQKINLQRELAALQYIMEVEEVSTKHLK